MYKDLISYELADGVSKEKLLTIANKILESWMSKQEGFVKWEIHQDVDTDGYADIVYWENVEAAKKAEKDMGNIHLMPMSGMDALKRGLYLQNI